MPFAKAEQNFHAAAINGINAQLYWPGRGHIPVTELVLDILLPQAYRGLDRFGVDPAVRDRLLGIVEERCRTRRNGAVWQVETVRALERGAGMDRLSALREMLRRYCSFLSGNKPVHTWPVEPAR